MLSKLAAGREKDVRFLAAAVGQGWVRPEILLERLATMDVPPDVRANMQSHLVTRPRPVC